MKKFLTILASSLLISTQAFASYFVVLKDGTKYKAKAKWTVVNGKAIVNLDNGQILQLDPAFIDVAKSEQVTKSGTGDLNVIDVGTNQPGTTTSHGSTLGASFRLHKQEAAPAPSAPAPVVATGPLLGQDVIDKFERAYENIGIFEHHVTSTGPHALRIELTADSEEKVFNAISATSFIIVRNAGIPTVQIDSAALFLKTTNGGAAGRFEMSREDATALDSKTMTKEDYFVRKVMF